MGKPTILCVDDEKDNLEALERIFRKKYTVLKATSGPEALQILDKNRVGVIISDQRMPGMTGVEFFQKVLDLHPEIPRILLTGYTDLNSAVTAINEAQIYRYLAKPWDSVDLEATVTQAIERFSLGEQIKEKNQQLELAYKELQSLDHAKNNFMILINHELKTPLTTILNFIGLMVDTPLNEEQKSYLAKIQISADRLRAMIDDALLIMKAETQQLKLDLVENHITDMEFYLTPEIHSLMTKKQVILDNRILEKGFLCDRRLFQQILQRLLHNAAKFCEPTSKIVFEMMVHGNHMIFKIRNKGPTLSEDLRRKVLQPFFIDENIMHHSSGVGLGLTVCEAILKTHQSHLSLENTKEGIEVSFSLIAGNSDAPPA